jgi:hypothetical protein
MITADGISVGVPSVVSPSIYWAPPSWKVNPDDAMEVVFVGRRLLLDAEMRSLGVEYLRAHNEASIEYWEKYLLGNHKPWWKKIF